MSIGRTFKESLQKGIRSMEIKRFGLGSRCQRRVADGPCEKPKSRKPESRKKEGRGNGQTTDDDDATIRGWREGEPPADTKEKKAADWPIPLDVLNDKLQRPCQGRIYYVRYAYKMGWTTEQIFELSKIEPVVPRQHQGTRGVRASRLLDAATDARKVRGCMDWAHAVMAWCDGMRAAGRMGDGFPERPDGLGDTCEHLAEVVVHARQWGYSLVQLATGVRRFPSNTCGPSADGAVWQPVYKLVDTCAAEFEAYTPYYYSSSENPPGHARVVRDLRRTSRQTPRYASQARPARPRPCRRNWLKSARTTPYRLPDDEIRVSERPKVVILGGGPNRIGQGIEFDYCCVHAVMAARKLGLRNGHDQLQPGGRSRPTTTPAICCSSSR